MCLKKGHFPNAWKHGNLVLFNKEGKSKIAGSYRPICLLDAWGKVLDRLLTRRLQFHLHSKSHISHAQYGFTHGRSTTDAIRSVLDTVNSYKADDVNICVIILDIKSAFNNVWWPGVLHELGKAGCPTNLYKLTRDFLADREIQYMKNGASIRKQRGCLQGSHSGPLLCNIVSNSS